MPRSPRPPALSRHLDGLAGLGRCGLLFCRCVRLRSFGSGASCKPAHAKKPAPPKIGQRGAACLLVKPVPLAEGGKPANMSAAHDEHYSPEWQSIGISDVQQTDSSVFKNLEFGLPTKWIPFGVRKNEQRGEGCFRQAQAAVSAVDALKSQVFNVQSTTYLKSTHMMSLEQQLTELSAKDGAPTPPALLPILDTPPPPPSAPALLPPANAPQYPPQRPCPRPTRPLPAPRSGPPRGIWFRVRGPSGDSLSPIRENGRPGYGWVGSL